MQIDLPNYFRRHRMAFVLKRTRDTSSSTRRTARQYGAPRHPRLRAAFARCCGTHARQVGMGGPACFEFLA